MAVARRQLTNVDGRMRDQDHLKMAVKPKKMQTGIPRNALEDIGNVTKQQGNNQGKAKLKQKENNSLEAKRKILICTDNAKKETSDVDGMVMHCKVLSISDANKASNKSGVAKTEPVLVSKDAVPEGVPAGIIDIDKESENDPYQCPEYAPDIFSYLAKIERNLQVKDYMPVQTEINERMRAILVDWLVQVHSRFGLLQETLYLTVYIIDRFLEVHVVSRSKLQLLGVSAMLIACKFEETYAPEIGDFVYISDNSYSKGQIKKMEQLILRTIKYDLSSPLSLHFLRRNSKAAHADAKKHTLAKYFMELTLLDYKMARLLPSEVASASLCLAGKVLNDSEWTRTLEFYSTYTESDLSTTIQCIATFVLKTETSKLQAVRAKYSSNKFMRVGTLLELKGDVIKKISM